MSETTTGRTRPSGPVGELRHGILNLADALAQSIALLSLALGSVTMSALLTNHTGWHPGWFTCFLIFMGALLVFAFFDIRFSTRTQLVLGAAGVVAILLLAIIVLAKGGDSGITIQPLDPT